MTDKLFASGVTQSISLLEKEGLDDLKNFAGEDFELLRKLERKIHLLRLTADALTVDKQQFLFRLSENQKM